MLQFPTRLPRGCHGFGSFSRGGLAPCPRPGRGCDPAHGRVPQARLAGPGQCCQEFVCKPGVGTSTTQGPKPSDLRARRAASADPISPAHVSHANPSCKPQPQMVFQTQSDCPFLLQGREQPRRCQHPGCLHSTAFSGKKSLKIPQGEEKIRNPSISFSNCLI